MIEVACVCGNRLKVQEEHAGLSIKCPKCRKLVAVALPAAESVLETLPPPGLSVPAAESVPETFPPSGLSSGDPTRTRAGRDFGAAEQRVDAITPSPLLEAVQRLTRVCESIRTLLAVLLGLLSFQILISLFRK